VEGKPKLSIIIVSYNVRQLLLACIRPVIETTEGISYEIIVVDNASSDGSAEAVRDAGFAGVQIVANKENVGFASANNQGYAISKGEFLLLLNPDTLVKPGAIKSMLEFMKNTPDAGMAACRLLNTDGSLQKSIQSFPSITRNLVTALILPCFLSAHNRQRTYFRDKPHKVDYTSGAFLLIRRAALADMPLFNQDFFMYGEEKDLALRLKKRGWNTYFVPSGEVIHHGGMSTDQTPVEMFLELQKSQIRFFFMHFEGWRRDFMLWSYYLSLCTYSVASMVFVFSSYGRYRLKLFLAAVRHYPSFAVTVCER
jgi:GT2 family glycosyltransferase